MNVRKGTECGSSVERDDEKEKREEKVKRVAKTGKQGKKERKKKLFFFPFCVPRTQPFRLGQAQPNPVQPTRHRSFLLKIQRVQSFVCKKTMAAWQLTSSSSPIAH
jgi:hypothetical protein